MNLTVRICLAVVLTGAASLAWSHSPMFLDYYEFDQSNDGETLTPAVLAAMRVRQQQAVLTECIDGEAGGFPCDKIDLQAFMPKAQLGAGSGVQLNDIWGWTDPVTGAEIAIVGLTNGTSFVDISEPQSPVHLGVLSSHNGGTSAWRDIKVFNDHAFIVADGTGNSTHGMQVFDLTQLADIVSPPQALSETAHHNGFGAAHNIAINEDSGFAYVVGSNQCSGGLYMIDIADPVNPGFDGCFSVDGYTHDVQCVLYNGPDPDHQGKEICVAYNEDTITIVDVSDKANPAQISRTPYLGSQYTHQGWFIDDTHSVVAMNDELDERNLNVPTRTYFYNVRNLDSPTQLLRYEADTASIDHNLYSRNGYVVQSNYRAGLRILSTEALDSGGLITSPSVSEVAFFDVIPNSDSAQFSGSWSNYVGFESENIIVSDIGGGLFVVRPDWAAISGGSDEVPPTVTPPSDIAVDAQGPTGTMATEVSIAEFLASASAIDDVDGALAISNNAPSEFPLGPTEVTFSAVDSAGNTGIAQASVEVVDLSDPVVVVPSDITVAAAGPGGTSATVVSIAEFLATASATDTVDGVLAVVNDAPAEFPLGTTAVMFSAVDSAGNVGNAAASVEVADQSAPVVAAPSSITIDAQSAAGTLATESSIAAFLVAAAATDDIDGVIATSNNAPAEFPLGMTVVTFSATDGAGNTGSAVAGVEVADLSDPVVMAPSNLIVDAQSAAGTPATEVPIVEFLAAASASDEVDGVLMTANDAPADFPLGTTVITFDAMDNAGNTGSAQASIEVADLSDPIVLAPNDLQLVVADAGGLPATDDVIVDFLSAATATDQVDGGLAVSSDAPVVFGAGSTTVTFSATDAAGNTGTAQADVNLEVNAAPVVNDPGPLFVFESSVALDALIIVLTAADANGDDSLGEWTITSGNISNDGDDDLPFSIDPATGEIRVNDLGDLSSALASSYSLGVVVSDGLTSSAAQTIVISILGLSVFVDGFES